MIKKITFLICFYLFSTLNANQINKIVATINKEPITQIDIMQTSQKFNIAPQEALNTLIERKLIIIAGNRFNIHASDDEVDFKINEIIKQNNLQSVLELESMLKQQNLSTEELKEDIRFDIIKQSLFGGIANDVKKPTKSDIKNYQKSHNLDSSDDKSNELSTNLSQEEEQIAQKLYDMRVQDAIANFLQKEKLKAKIEILN